MLLQRLDVTIQALLWSDKVTVRRGRVPRCAACGIARTHAASLLPLLTAARGVAAWHTGTADLQDGQVGDVVAELEAKRAALTAEPALVEVSDVLEASSDAVSPPAVAVCVCVCVWGGVKKAR